MSKILGTARNSKVLAPSFVILVLLSVFLVAIVPSQRAASAPDNQVQSPEGGGGPGPLSTGFTYQGQLINNGAPANGTCDFQFKLYDQSGTGVPPTGGIQLGATETDLSISVSKGLFSVVLNYNGEFGNTAFDGNGRWLEIAVRCPSAAGNYQTLSPRQFITGTPYTLGLRPGTVMNGISYQNLKIQSSAPSGGIPAGVTGEMLVATDGVGVYGSNTVTTAGATGIGVWGRSYSPNGTGVKATGYNGANGLNAVNNGVSINASTIFAENTNAGGTEPAGIAIFAKNHSADATLVIQNAGNSNGDAIRTLNSAGSSVIFRVTSTGRVVTSAVQVYGGGDLAEQFPASNGTVEPGTLMVIDDQNPGMLKPSDKPYDTCVAGVVSGAGGVNPGMTLQPEGVLQGNTPIAIAGRVYVRAEAFSAPIKPGDLLTTSTIPGVAMKASDPNLAQGAVIGKAMSSLESGTGLVLLLITLQ